MFTGLVEEVGVCLWLKRGSKGVQLTVVASRISEGLHTGDSVAVNGCCLTVSSHRKTHVTFDLLQQTVDLTNLGKLRPEAYVNLERALRAGGRLGGHFVQGHVDNVASVLGMGEHDGDVKLEISLPPQYARYVAMQGSICINGVSLTVAELSETSFSVWIIPHTWARTNLRKLAVGDSVNLEFDILAKYCERSLVYGLRPPASDYQPVD